MANQADLTRSELIEKANEVGFEITQRTFTDWVARGLLAQAHRSGAGRGSKAGTWSENQAVLLQVLLRLQPQAKHLHVLANIPVWLWLRHGDDYVDTTQAHRAMETWAEKNVVGARSQVKRTARELVSDLGSERPPSNTLVDGLALILTGKNTTTAMITKAIDQSVRPELSKLFAAPSLDRPIDDVEAYLRLLRWRIEGAQAFAPGQSHVSAATPEMEQARFAYRASRFGYTTSLGRNLDQLEINDEVNNACLQFSAQFGILRERTRP